MSPPDKRRGPSAGPLLQDTGQGLSAAPEDSAAVSPYSCGTHGCRYCRRSVFAALDELLADAVPGTVVVPIRGGGRR